MKPPMILLYMKSGNIIRGYLKDKDIFEGVTHNDVIDDVRKADIIGYNLLIVDKYNELGT